MISQQKGREKRAKKKVKELSGFERERTNILPNFEFSDVRFSMRIKKDF